MHIDSLMKARNEMESKIQEVEIKEIREAMLGMYKDDPSYWTQLGFYKLYESARLIFCVE